MGMLRSKKLLKRTNKNIGLYLHTYEKKRHRKDKVECSKSADLQGLDKNKVESKEGRKDCLSTIFL